MATTRTYSVPKKIAVNGELITQIELVKRLLTANPTMTVEELRNTAETKYAHRMSYENAKSAYCSARRKLGLSKPRKDKKAKPTPLESFMRRNAPAQHHKDAPPPDVPKLDDVITLITLARRLGVAKSISLLTLVSEDRT